MKLRLVIALVFVTVLAACNHKQSAPSEQSKTSELNKAKVDSFFPVTSFLKGQLRSIDSLPITPLRVNTIKEKSDSIWLKKNELAQILSPFFSQEIAETNLTGLFKETKFNDLSLNAITFTYDPKDKLPDSVSLIHWDVYINPETGEVSKVYLVRRIKGKEKNITQQLTWLTNKWAKIVSLEDRKDGSAELLQEEKIIWSF